MSTSLMTGTFSPGMEDGATLKSGAKTAVSAREPWWVRPASGLTAGLIASRPKMEFPSTEQLLTDGGDARIACEPRGRNRYGCSALPEPGIFAYGSSTASTVSPAAFADADALRNLLKAAARTEAASLTYERETDRVRTELKKLCGLEELSGLEIILGASGTDLHLFASQLMVEPGQPRPLIVRVETTETGSGVPDALAGCHFSDLAALGDTVSSTAPLDCGRSVDILEIKCRTAGGQLRPLAAIDAEIEKNVVAQAEAGRRVLLNLVDVSKTGFLAPSPACVDALHRRFPELIEVLVDACQFRLAPSTLKAYLENDFLVAITGSKFVTGPTFCGALLVPEAAAQRMKTHQLPRALKSYSAAADWPRHWNARTALSRVSNYGLLLRWEAALSELRAFRQLPEIAVSDFVKMFARAVTKHLSHRPGFAPLSLPALDRGPIAPSESWDCVPTIFPFLLMRKPASGRPAWLSRDETRNVHELLRHLGFQLGQPVACGTRDGIPVSALRLCLSTRLIVDALSPKGRGAHAVTAEAIAVLDRTAAVASSLLI